MQRQIFVVDTDLESAPVDATSAAHRLRQLKWRVRVAMDTYGEKRWRQMVDVRLPKTSRARPASRAYHKMLDIIRACVLPRPARSLHICEAPGGFVQACMDAFPGLDWRAASREDGGPVFCPSLNAERIWRDGCDDGDIRKGDVRDRVCAWAGASTFDLVTADGAGDVDHDDIEASTRPLLDAQVAVAVRTLRTGGVFVVKFFEGLEEATVSALWNAARHFGTWIILKPQYSRPTNSERYAVYADFRAVARALDDPVQHVWAAHVRRILMDMASSQTRALENVLNTHAGAPM